MPKYTFENYKKVRAQVLDEAVALAQTLDGSPEAVFISYLAHEGSGWIGKCIFVLEGGGCTMRNLDDPSWEIHCSLPKSLYGKICQMRELGDSTFEKHGGLDICIWSHDDWSRIGGGMPFSSRPMMEELSEFDFAQRRPQ